MSKWSRFRVPGTQRATAIHIKTDARSPVLLHGFPHPRKFGSPPQFTGGGTGNRRKIELSLWVVCKSVIQGLSSDPQIATRNWQFVMDEMVKLKKGETQHRWQTAIKDKAFNLIRHLPILETRPEHFLRVLETGKVSTNVYLRRIHNFTLDMTWLPWPVIVKRQWPKVQFKDKRTITWDEHRICWRRG